MIALPSPEQRILDTQRAFDSVASEYDGPLGNNLLVQHMRTEMWRTVERVFPQGSYLADLGCGTGLDAVHFAREGYRILALDASIEMVRKAEQAVDRAGVRDRVQVRHLAIDEIGQLEAGSLDGLYSDLGAVNCVPNLRAIVEPCAQLLRRRGRLVLSVIGRTCPWELAYYLLRHNPARARVRLARQPVPVSLNGHRVWTQYYSPAELSSAFSTQFACVECRALHLFLPPPYLISLYRRRQTLFIPLAWLDDHLGTLPGLRQMGDSFLIVLEHHG